jgi:general secretion pathway protein J
VSSSKARAQQGFTLLEVLLALSIAAVIAVIAYQALSSAVTGAEKTREVMQEINQLDRTWQIIAADLRQVLPPEAGPSGLRFEFIGAGLRAEGSTAQQVILFFTRRGWVNPMLRLRSDLQIVSYRIDEGQLWRDYLPERNIALEDLDFEFEAFNQLLLEGVTDMQVRFLSSAIIQNRGRGALEGEGYSDDWELEWPSLDQNATLGLPLAVEVTIEIEGVGPSVRLFELGR